MTIYHELKVRRVGYQRMVQLLFMRMIDYLDQRDEAALCMSISQDKSAMTYQEIE